MAEDGTEAGLNRPRPPEHLFSIESAYDGLQFVPAPELVEWARATFIDEGAPLENEDHAHLRSATIGALWTNVDNSRRGRMVVGQAEMGKPQGTLGKWARARAEQQICEWFDGLPDFILTFSAPFMVEQSDATFCAIVEHELYHCGQDRDVFGMPKFSRESGLPAFTIRGHDIEEFVGVVRRYGAGASGVSAMISAAQEGPTIAASDIAHACGTCLR